MTGKRTQNIDEIRRMRNRVSINMILKGYEVWQHRKRDQGGQDRTHMGFKNRNQTIITNIVKRDKDVKGTQDTSQQRESEININSERDASYWIW